MKNGWRWVDTTLPAAIALGVKVRADGKNVGVLLASSS